MLSGTKIGSARDGLPITKVCRLHAHMPAKRAWSRTETRIEESLKAVRQITWDIEGRRTNVDVDHELFVSWPNGGVETSPSLEACTERKGRLGGGRMEELVSSYHHTVADGPIRECGEDEVQCRYDGHDIVTAVLRLAGEVAKKTSGQYKKEK